MDIISSIDNPQIKHLRSLAEKKFRKLYGEYVLEGIKTVKEALAFGENVTQLFVSVSKLEEFRITLADYGGNVVVCSDALFQKLSETVTPQGIIAIAKMKQEKELKNTGKPFLVLDRIADPGNLGTIIRTAVATGFNDIVLLDTADPFNPKTVRSSASGIFAVNFHSMNEQAFIDFCKNSGVQMLVADAHGVNIFKDKMPAKNYCIVIGNEANGPSKTIKESADKIISLPMKPEMESLNAGICASIMMYAFVGKDL